MVTGRIRWGKGEETPELGWVREPKRLPVAPHRANPAPRKRLGPDPPDSQPSAGRRAWRYLQESLAEGVHTPNWAHGVRARNTARIGQ